MNNLNLINTSSHLGTDCIFTPKLDKLWRSCLCSSMRGENIHCSYSYFAMVDFVRLKPENIHVSIASRLRSILLVKVWLDRSKKANKKTIRISWIRPESESFCQRISAESFYSNHNGVKLCQEFWVQSSLFVKLLASSCHCRTMQDYALCTAVVLNEVITNLQPYCSHDVKSDVMSWGKHNRSVVFPFNNKAQDKMERFLWDLRAETSQFPADSVQLYPKLSNHRLLCLIPISMYYFYNVVKRYLAYNAFILFLLLCRS